MLILETQLLNLLMKSHLLEDRVILHQLKTLRSVLTVLCCDVTACTWQTAVLDLCALQYYLYTIAFCFLCHGAYSPITLISFQST